MKIFQSLAFKIWLIFTIVGLSLSIPMAVHYSNVHYNLLKLHSEDALYSNALITKQAIEIAIENNDLQGLRNQLDQIKKSSEFSYIALIEGTGENHEVLACFPDTLKHLVFTNNENYIEIEEPLESKLFSGSIVMASSLDEDLKTLAQINRPVVYLSTIAILSSIVLFGFSLFFISRPISKAVVFAQELEQKNYQHSAKRSTGKDEISTLNNALISLSSNLRRLESDNQQLLDHLEDQVELKTEQLRTQNRLNRALYELSKSFINAKTSNYKDVVSQGLQTLTPLFGINTVMFIDLEAESWNIAHSNSKELIDKKILSFAKLEDALGIQKVKVPEEIQHLVSESSSLHLLPNIPGFQDKKRLLVFQTDDTSEDHIEDIGQSFLAISSIINNLEQRIHHEIELRQLNSELENKVIENTKVNLDLSNSIVTQDKLATIGEVAAGVAHDLNSPLGAIKASNANIWSILKQIFHHPEEWDWGNNVLSLQIDPKGERNIFPSGVQLIKDVKIMEGELLDKVKPNIDTKMLANALVRCGIQVHENEVIEKVLSLDEPIKFLNSLRQIQLITNFQNSITESIARASEVISNLTLFVREDLTQEKTSINLKKSIDSVEKVFKHRMKHEVAFENKVSEDLFIHGIEVKLLQLWSNIIKNAIDALDDLDKTGKYIHVSASENKDSIVVEIENNGPMIPHEDQKRILKKFYTTKANKKGTGLGMSIVKNVVDEHRGSLDFSSNEEKTIFSVSFPKASS